MRLVTFLALVAIASAQMNPSSIAADKWRAGHETPIVQEFFDLLAIPNVAADKPNIERNAAAIAAMLRKRGVPARLLEFAGASPLVYGEIKTPGATRTVVFYAHYDGQPVDAKEWNGTPFTPVLRNAPLEKDGQAIPLPQAGKSFDPEWRIYARSASDDKAPILAMVTALDALHDAKITLHSNIKFVFEGEEEAGSTHLGEILAANKQLLRGDVWLICDGPVHQSRRQQVVFGARGVTTVDLTVYGPRRELHSGHYGNWAPNPALMLARLLASMKDEDGRVLIDHFYDGVEPLSARELKAISDTPVPDADLMRELWLGRTEGGGRKLAELITLPSLNIRGMASARIGDRATNVIPSLATATIDLRLVKAITPQQAVARLIDHIRKQGYFITDQEPGAEIRTAHPKVARVVQTDAGYPAVRTSMDLPISREIVKAVESARGPSILSPTTGGSVPLYLIESTLGSPTISIPIANHDNSQHSFNENIRLRNLWDGINLMAALLTM